MPASICVHSDFFTNPETAQIPLQVPGRADLLVRSSDLSCSPSGPQLTVAPPQSRLESELTVAPAAGGGSGLLNSGSGRSSLSGKIPRSLSTSQGGLVDYWRFRLRLLLPWLLGTLES